MHWSGHGIWRAKWPSLLWPQGSTLRRAMFVVCAMLVPPIRHYIRMSNFRYLIETEKFLAHSRSSFLHARGAVSFMTEAGFSHSFYALWILKITSAKKTCITNHLPIVCRYLRRRFQHLSLLFCLLHAVCVVGVAIALSQVTTRHSVEFFLLQMFLIVQFLCGGRWWGTS